MGIRDHTLSVTHEKHVAKVLLDGQDISKTLRGLSVRFDPGSFPMATLDVAVFQVPIEADRVRVEVPEETAALLVGLGWTPPQEKK